jgi:hypothetical protein
MTRLSSGAATTFIDGGALPIPGWLRLTVNPGFVSGYISADGITWAKIGDANVGFDLSTRSYTMGLAVTSHDVSRLNTSAFDNVLIDWANQDVGNVGTHGSAAFADGKFTIRGGGSDIWGTADSFQYVYRPLSGSSSTYQIVATVLALPQNTNPYAKAGVMIRDSLRADAAHVMLDVKPDGHVEMLVRSATGGTTAFVGGGTLPSIPGGVLMLNADGQTFTGRVCQADRTGCQVIGTATAAVSASGFIGMAVTSHDPTVTTAATLTSVGIY